MRSLKKEKYSNGLESGRWYKCYQDGQMWLFRIYKYDEVENFIYVDGITYALDGDDMIKYDYPPNCFGIDGVRYGRWEFYHDNALLYSKGIFIDGVRDGIWDYYNKDSVELSYKKLYECGRYIRDIEL